jgi:hypothetical protein
MSEEATKPSGQVFHSMEDFERAFFPEETWVSQLIEGDPHQLGAQFAREVLSNLLQKSEDRSDRTSDQRT